MTENRWYRRSSSDEDRQLLDVDELETLKAECDLAAARERIAELEADRDHWKNLVGHREKIWLESQSSHDRRATKLEQERDAARAEAGALREALEDERERHTEDDSSRRPLGYCATCGTDWPCDSVRRMDAAISAEPRPAGDAREAETERLAGMIGSGFPIGSALEADAREEEASDCTCPRVPTSFQQPGPVHALPTPDARGSEGG